jgi:hypothetical protein
MYIFSCDIVVAEIVAGLWDLYRSKKSIQIRTNLTGHDPNIIEGEDVWLGQETGNDIKLIKMSENAKGLLVFLFDGA